jgi:cytochrome c oxidase cbb3-type subunit 2
MYDHPFQWGSKRTGPDLARVGNKYSDSWHLQHMTNPRSVVPTSIMPGYPFLAQRPIDPSIVAADIRTNWTLGVPYTEAQLANIAVDFRAQANPDDANVAAFAERYPRAVSRDFDGNPRQVTEMDALIAYLQVLGTMVDFRSYDARANLR